LITHAVPDILRRQLQSARHQIAKFTELPHGIRRAGAQTVDMRAALGCRNQIHVAFGNAVLGLEHPGESPIQRPALDIALAVKGFGRQPFSFAEFFRQVLVQSAGIEPFVLFAADFVLQRDPQIRTQHGLGSQHLLELRNGELVGVEIFGVRPESDGGAGLGLRHLADDFELGSGLAAGKAQVVLLATAPHPAFQVLRERVHDRHAHAVQSAGVLIGLVVEFPAGMQTGQDQLHAAYLFLRMDVHGHAATVVLNLARTVLEQRDIDAIAVAVHGFIHAVIDYLMREMIRPRGVGVHAGTPANRIQAAQHLDVGGRIRRCHQLPHLEGAGV
jgi:hypothetical protein